MNSTETLSTVIAALAADGFESSLTATGVNFRGSVIANGIVVLLRLEYRDLEFCEPPYVFVENPAIIPRPVLPHLDDKDELCVVDRGEMVADRYSAAAQARGILVRAKEVIERGLTKHATGEIAEEFPQHWGGQGVGVEFSFYDGPTEIAPGIGRFARVRRCQGNDSAMGFAITTSARLSFTETQKRPSTLSEVLGWAAFWDQALPDKITSALSDLSAADPTIFLVAPNGTVGFSVNVSARGSALVDALKRPSGWRKALRSPAILGLPITRLRGYRADIDYAFERSGDGVPVLSGKTVVLVGCGSIGGFLARAAAQLGAGRGGGKLILIDGENLANANIARHLLGTEAVDQPKAQACRDLILRDLPGAAIVSRPAKIQSQRSLIKGADLIVDATGEHGVSEMLNAWMVETLDDGEPFPDLLHVWIEGPGAAVQTFFSSDPGFACLRCLKPDLGEPSRFSALRHEETMQLSGTCGEDRFTPYGPAAPMMAAANAAQHIYDWATANPRPLLRTGRLDWEKTKDVKPTNPTPSRRCPACDRAEPRGKP